MADTDIHLRWRAVLFARPDGRTVLGWFLVAAVIGVCFLGPLLAPHPIDEPIGAPGESPSRHALLGTDLLGRDVLSRVLNGGLSLVVVALIAVVLTYAIAILVGSISGLSRSRLDGVLMRGVDIFLVLPPLLLLLVLVSGTGSSSIVLVVGIVLVLFPGAARLVRTATLDISTAGFIEAAVIRGETRLSILRREVLPNIAPALIADAGVRFLGAIFLVASINFLGVGSQPPAANWALMIAENRAIISLNIWSVLAPAILLTAITVGVNLVGDAYSGRSLTSRNK